MDTTDASKMVRHTSRGWPSPTDREDETAKIVASEAFRIFEKAFATQAATITALRKRVEELEGAVRATAAIAAIISLPEALHVPFMRCMEHEHPEMLASLRAALRAKGGE